MIKNSPSLPHPVGAAARVVGPLRGLRDLTGALTWLLSIAALAGLVSGYASLRRSVMIDGVLAGGRPDDAGIVAADAFVRVAGFAHVVACIPVMVLFVLWSWWLTRNAALLDRHAAPQDGWVVGSWLVPIANLWLPARNLIRVDRIAGGTGDRHTTASRRVIISWATALGLAAVGLTWLWRLGARGLVTVQDVETYAFADRAELVFQIMLALAAGLAVIMIRRLTQRQEHAFAARVG